MPRMNVTWNGAMGFEAQGPSGTKLLMDAYPDSGGANAGPSPVETLVAALAGCMGMDVISILRKKQQNVKDYRIEVDWERGPDGVFPRPVTRFVVRHIVSGEVDPVALQRAVELSDQKYCSVAATLRTGPEIAMEWSVEAEAAV